MSSGRSPPTSQESESFPSENAPAPENPVVMRQGLQCTHTPVFVLGQLRRSMGRPRSTSMIWRVSLLPSRPSAVKMPAGPAPMMSTSVVREMVAMMLLLKGLAHLSLCPAAP